jgi:hypothetical protein
MVLKRENYFKTGKRHACVGFEPNTLQLSHTYFTSALLELYDSGNYFNYHILNNRILQFFKYIF